MEAGLGCVITSYSIHYTKLYDLTVNTTLSEAFAICAALDDVQRQQLHASVAKLKEHARQCSDPRAFLTGYRDAVGPCPFLDATNNCSIYACRPLACRALLATRPPDWCGVNLALLPEIDRDGFRNNFV